MTKALAFGERWDGAAAGLELVREPAPDVAAILTLPSFPVDGALMDALPMLRVIGTASVGYDHVDLEAAEARGIAVVSVPDYCTEEVADHTLALLLALERRLLDYHRQVQERHSWRWNDVTGIRRLAGQSLGLVGFGLAVLAADPRVDADVVRHHGAEPVTLDALLARADIVSLHCNLDSTSRGLMNRAAFAKMGRRPRLINVARGGLVVEAELADALDAGRVAGAALDVLAEDSPDLGHHPLVGRGDVILTPHVAFYSEAALDDLRRISADNIRAFLEGRPNDVFRLVPAAAP